MHNLIDTSCTSTRPGALSIQAGNLRHFVILLLCLPSFLCTQAPASNRVLQLTDGKSYVEPPPNIINDFTEVTVEGWVRWDELVEWSPCFFFGAGDYRLAAMCGNAPTALWSILDYGKDESGVRNQCWLFSPSTLVEGRWTHIAVTVSSDGITAYVNGVARGNRRGASLSMLKGHTQNRLGALKETGQESFTLMRGAMDEVRVWKTARTPQEIRDRVVQRLTGAEPGLVALWNFDDPANPGRDAGPRGLAMAKEHRPAVITLDVMMPAMDGWAVLTALKADPDTADIPVIMMTIVDDKHMGFALGAADYFTKPIEWHRLAAALKKHRDSRGSLSVLLVEDDAATRDMLRRSMEKEGWRVTEAAHGRHGLERLSESQPSLILLDLMMPEMDGFNFLQELRARPDGHHVPVIVITAKDLTPEDRRRLNGEVARILQKGTTSADDLLAEIRSLLPVS